MNNIMKPTTYDPTRYTTVADFGLSHCIYPKWALVRVAKLISIFGAEWFNGKTVLELACGLGLVGQELQKYGAKVTFTEGRSEYLNEIIQHANGSEVYQIDQDEPWDFGRKFDLVLHWGVLYHLQGWNRDLKTALNHGTFLSLDTEVLDNNYNNIELLIHEAGYNQSIHNVGSRPSWAYIEEILIENSESFQRYDDVDLNIVDDYEPIRYDWKAGDVVAKNAPGNTFPANHWIPGYRRFWVVKCK